MKTFLIYGSYGYTGQLIVERAAREGMRPILAGRNERKLRAQAEKHNLEYRAFSLDETAKLDSALLEADAVLHCAGPFVLTFRQMAEACLRAKRHYVDISGEIEGFEALAKLNDEAKKANVMLLPGGGFDVVPSDCLAAYLKQRLPTATHFRLFLRGVGGGVSRGTARSAIENIHRQGRIRREGQIVQVPPAWQVLEQDFGRGPVKVVSVGWGDVSTAYYSTGVPNVETYFAFPRVAIHFLKLSRTIGPLVYSRPMRSLLKWLIGFAIPPGPTRRQNEAGFSLMVGEMRSEGQIARAKLRSPEGYRCTALTAVEIMKRILEDNYRAGFQTPSLAYGADFILQFDGVEREDLL
ncbi:MAG: saccharopine dehydrogenase NADP-binding domain-containing protein [Anaerolineales bacterium]|nr:saccharopine dehydrogenase NADP-binding domain-containing protein [Anaerolineales bacterium]NUQ85121.1 saccharopine dehydrogenase NADP-binding domain-containing protein [Anaerolineales bacterium]